MANRKISWDKHALKQFNKAILYIAEDSIQNAENVRIDILIKIGELLSQPEKYLLINTNSKMMVIIKHLNCIVFE